MIGREGGAIYRRKPLPAGDVLIRVEELRTPAHPQYPIAARRPPMSWWMTDDSTPL